RSFGSLGRRLGYAIIDGARVTINLEPFQPRRVGILQVLHNPQPPSIIEFDAYRLAHPRLGSDETDLAPLPPGDRLWAYLRAVTLCQQHRRNRDRAHECRRGNNQNTSHALLQRPMMCILLAPDS